MTNVLEIVQRPLHRMQSMSGNVHNSKTLEQEFEEITKTENHDDDSRVKMGQQDLEHMNKRRRTSSFEEEEPQNNDGDSDYAYDDEEEDDGWLLAGSNQCQHLSAALEYELHDYCERTTQQLGMKACYQVVGSTVYLFVEINCGLLCGHSARQMEQLALAEKPSVCARMCFRVSENLQSFELLGFMRDFPPFEAGIHKVEGGSFFHLDTMITQSCIGWVLGDRLKSADFRQLVAKKPLQGNRLVDSCVRVFREIKRKCMICNDDLPMEVFKPTVCMKEHCLFQTSVIGLGLGLESILLREPEVFMVRFELLYLAAKKNGSAMDLCYPKNLGAHDAQLFPMPNTITSVLTNTPHILHMVRWASTSGMLRAELDNLDKGLFPLLQWLVGSCQTHIRLLEPNEQFADLKTKWQFELTLPVDQVARFEANKKTMGSFLAFHGSNMANWHSILRLGIRNFNLREKERKYAGVNGRVFGDGIYVSTRFNDSLRYSYQSHGIGQFPIGGMACVAICEIINNNPERHTHRDGTLHVIPQEDMCKLKYLVFVEHDKKNELSNIKAEQLEDQWKTNCVTSLL